MNNEIAIKVENLSKIYKLYDKPIDRVKEVFSFNKKNLHHEFYALKDISFEVKRGETIGAIGKNGSGKSTLLKIITGVLTPTAGTVQVDGRVAALLELGAGFNPEYTGMENIFLQGSIMGYSHDEMTRRVEEIMDFADIGKFIHQPVKTYSSGMFVRLAFAVNSCIEPDILIVDEALSVGDFFFVQKCYNKIEEIMKKGTAVIFVTHNMADLVRFCSSALLLDQGVCLYQGDPLFVMQKYLSSQRSTDNNAIDNIKMDNVVSNPSGYKVENWVAEECFLNLSGALQEGNGRVICRKIGISDDKGRPSATFEIGQTIIFYSEYEVIEDIDTPLCGVDIVDSRNNIVHGKHSLHYELKSLGAISKRSIICCKQKVQLNIAPGDYTYVIGMAMLNEEYYGAAATLTQSKLMHHMERVISVSKVSVFSVIPRKNGLEIPFHGMCDLEGSCEMFTTDDMDRYCTVEDC